MSARERWMGFLVWCRCFLNKTKLIFSLSSGAIRPSCTCFSTTSSGGNQTHSYKLTFIILISVLTLFNTGWWRRGRTILPTQREPWQLCSLGPPRMANVSPSITSLLPNNTMLLFQCLDCSVTLGLFLWRIFNSFIRSVTAIKSHRWYNSLIPQV